MAGKQNFPLRISDSVMDAVKSLANSEIRSTNAMIEILLMEALKARKRPIRPRAQTPPEKAD